MQQHYQGIVPYLFYDDAGAAMDWYIRVFGFEETGRWTNEEGKVQNGEMRVGQSEVCIDGSGRRNDTDERPQWVGIWVDDVGAVYDHIKAAGIECEPPVDREFGVRMLNVEGGLGYLWGFIKRL